MELSKHMRALSFKDKNNKMQVDSTLDKQNTIDDTSIGEATDSSNKPDSSTAKKTFDIEDSDAPRLVSYSFLESSDVEKTTLKVPRKRNKKRAVNKMNWNSNKNKLNRQHGRNYSSKRKDEQGWNYDITKKSKSLKPICHCALSKKSYLKCLEFSDDQRNDIFKRFWSMSWNEKKIFVDGTVESCRAKRSRDQKSDNSRRKLTFKYSLPLLDGKKKVCKTMYCNTLCVGPTTIQNWKKSVSTVKSTPNVNTAQKEKKKSNHRREKEYEEMEIFLESLPKMESHYCRASSSKLYLQPEWQSKKTLYEFYVQNWCKDRNIKALSLTTFYQMLDEKNIDLYAPKKDQCDICVRYRVGNFNENDYQTHIKNKLDARKEKDSDKLNEDFVFTMDLQSVLLSPKSQVSSLYYKTKLSVHNFCLFNLKNSSGFCYIWNETEGGLNSEEFASIIFKFISTHVVPFLPESNKKIIFYSDGCTYQNRNCTLSSALVNAAKLFGITIEQKYLEKGHTQMEADSMHAAIERKLRNKIINVPADYVDVCKTAVKKAYTVEYLNFKDFKSFNKIKSYSSIRPGSKTGDPVVTNIRGLKYPPNGDIYYKLNFSDEWNLLPQRKNKIKSCLTFEQLPGFYRARLKIKKIKYDDLQELKKTLPIDYHQFYDNLPYEK